MVAYTVYGDWVGAGWRDGEKASTARGIALCDVVESTLHVQWVTVQWMVVHSDQIIDSQMRWRRWK